MRDAPKPSDKRNGCFLDEMWCCKVCDGEIPDGHTPDCDIWKLEKLHRDFLANEYNTVLLERDALKAENERLREALERIRARVESVPINQRENDEIAVLEFAEDALGSEP